MTSWNKILDQPVGRTAIQKFAMGELNCEEVQKVFRAGSDRSLSGEVRSLIRNKGTAEARKVARKALRRRNLI